MIYKEYMKRALDEVKSLNEEDFIKIAKIAKENIARELKVFISKTNWIKIVNEISKVNNFNDKDNKKLDDEFKKELTKLMKNFK